MTSIYWFPMSIYTLQLLQIVIMGHVSIHFKSIPLTLNIIIWLCINDHPMGVRFKMGPQLPLPMVKED